MTRGRAPAPARWWWGVPAAAAAGVAALWFIAPGDPSPAPDGSVRVVPVTAPAPPPGGAAGVVPGAPATPLLEPPVAPALPDVAPAPADAFVGSWSGEGGERLRVERSGERYRLVLARDGGEETYDGVLRDGRVHFERGIDGDWLQATVGGATCLRLGSGARYCRH